MAACGSERASAAQTLARAHPTSPRSSCASRSTPIEYILRGQPEAGEPVFSSECLKWPGFVEFDDVNCKVLTYSALDHAFRVWELKSYEQLYMLPGVDVTEIKVSPGIMLLIHARQGG